MDMQQLFAQRLLSRLDEKKISQQEFAEKMGCSRQSINFYILGKRSPDIALAGKMASFLGVSCDYLIGLSDYIERGEAGITVDQAGISPDVMKFFYGLKIMADGLDDSQKAQYENSGLDFEKELLPHIKQHAEQTLNLLNMLIAHDAFGQLLQMIKRYSDLLHGIDDMSALQNFMIETESPFTGRKYGTKEENETLIREFSRFIINKYFVDIVSDICK